jgi:uncharacterized protein
MSPAPADHVNAVELAGRSAELERHLTLGQLPRLRVSGALEGTHVEARLTFGRFDGRTTVRAQVQGEVILTCQRCMRPCACGVAEDASLVVVRSDAEEVPGGYEPLLGDAERLSLGELIEEQVLLGLPLVPKHAEERCGETTGDPRPTDAAPVTDDRQRPFANLRELLDKGGR